MATSSTKAPTVPPGMLGGFFFFAVVLAGCGYIVLAKIAGLNAVLVTLVPVLIMISYAVALAAARFLSVRLIMITFDFKLLRVAG
jgi:hypothetical protein